MTTQDTTRLTDLEWRYQHALADSGVPEHLHDGLIRYLAHRIQPGGFLMAVLENDLAGALNRADGTSRAGLVEIGRFLYNDVPQGAWGSPAKVAAWLAEGRS